MTAQRQILEANLDRRVFDLGQDIARATGSVLDAMRGLPGVTVSQDGQIQLRGSDRVAILIDGKQSGLTGIGNQSGLDSIPAGSIASIEVINNPSAAYDANGMAGVINIVYRQDQAEGLQLDTGLSLGVGALDKRKPDLPTELGSFSSNGKINPRVNLVNNSDRGGYFVQADVLFQEDLPNNEFTTRYYDDGRVTLSQVPENREQEQVVVRGGFDREIDDYRSWTFSSLFDFEHHTDVAQVPYIDAVAQELYRYWFWQEEEKTGHLNLVLTHTREFEQPGKELSWSVQYTRGWEDEAYFLNDRSALRNAQDETHLDALEHTLPFQLDYVKPLRNGRMETGFKLQRREIPVEYHVNRGEDTVIYPGLGDWSEWGEDIYAGYVNYVREQPKYAVEVGFRAEQTDVRYDLPPENIYYSQSDAYDYFEPLPNVRLTYNVERHGPPCHLLQQSRRSPRRTRAADLPEVRRPRDLEGRQSVPAAAVHGALRARLRAGLGPRERCHLAVPAQHRRSVRARVRDRRQQSRLRHREPHLPERRQRHAYRRRAHLRARNRRALAALG